MKKFTLLACLMTVSAGLAVAQSVISVPFFADNANVRQGYVGIQNVGSSAIVVTASYLDSNGANAAAGGTFTLTSGQSISYRPATNAGTAEVQPAGLLDAPYGNGSIAFDIPGGGLVSGRYISLEGNGSAFSHNLVQQ